MVFVTIRLGELEVCVQSTESHPDHLDDLTNRAIAAFANILPVCTDSGVSLYGDEPEIDLPEE